jgi:hypothetical protein
MNPVKDLSSKSLVFTLRFFPEYFLGLLDRLISFLFPFRLFPEHFLSVPIFSTRFPFPPRAARRVPYRLPRPPAGGQHAMMIDAACVSLRTRRADRRAALLIDACGPTVRRKHRAPCTKARARRTAARQAGTPPRPPCARGMQGRMPRADVGHDAGGTPWRRGPPWTRAEEGSSCDLLCRHDLGC